MLDAFKYIFTEIIIIIYAFSIYSSFPHKPILDTYKLFKLLKCFARMF